jgi:hypothetical protein
MPPDKSKPVGGNDMKEQNGVIEMEAGSVDWEIMSDMIGVDEDGNEFWSDDFVRVNNLFIKPEFRSQACGSSRRAYTEAVPRHEDQDRG